MQANQPAVAVSAEGADQSPQVFGIISTDPETRHITTNGKIPWFLVVQHTKNPEGQIVVSVLRAPSREPHVDVPAVTCAELGLVEPDLAIAVAEAISRPVSIAFAAEGALQEERLDQRSERQARHGPLVMNETIGRRRGDPPRRPRQGQMPGSFAGAP